MASAPQTAPLPIFYQALEPLSSEAHANYKVRPSDRAPFLVHQHAVPVTCEEFPLVQRHLPIVFTVGDDAVPIALMGMNEGVNVFFDENGRLVNDQMYVPAYIRRYPYMLAKLHPDAQELSLCFDPTTDTIGAFEEGNAFFENGKPTQLVNDILTFNESFEQAGIRTNNFMNDLREMKLLMDGEISIQQEGSDKPFIYRGFQMIDEAKLAELRGDQLRKIHKNGMLPLIYAHLFSLSLMRDIFALQVQQGKLPQPELTVPDLTVQ